jgi:hypothetical protein
MAIELTTASAATLSGIQVYTGHLTLWHVFPNGTLGISNGQFYPNDGTTSGDTLDFSHPDWKRVHQVTISQYGNWYGLTKIIGGANLTNIQDFGTQLAVIMVNTGFSAATLNAFFTALPTTSKTATINIAGCTGALTCNTSIATGKGYTVVTS